MGFKNLDIKAKIDDFTRLKEVAHENIGSIIAANKFDELQDLLMEANYSINQGLKKNHETKVNNVTDESSQNIVQFYYLKYAILNYNACYDYILQIIYFGFDFFSEIKSTKDYEDNLEKCRLQNNDFKKKIDGLKTENTKAATFFAEYDKFIKNAEKEKLTNWANVLKHRGGFVIKDVVTKYNYIKVSKADDPNNVIFDTHYITPATVTLEEIKECLLKNNKNIYEFAMYLYGYLGFKNINNSLIQPLDKPFSARKDKCVYCKKYCVSSYSE